MILLDPRLTIDPKWRLEKEAIAGMVGHDALLSTDDFFRFISRGKDTLGEIESSWKVVRNGVIREVCKGNPETERFLTKSMHQSEIDRIKDGITEASKNNALLRGADLSRMLGAASKDSRSYLREPQRRIRPKMRLPEGGRRFWAAPSRCSAYIPTGMRASHRFGSLQNRAAAIGHYLCLPQ